MRGILSCQKATEDLDIAQKAKNSLQWLVSKPVEGWYWSLTELQHRIFSTLLYHIAMQCNAALLAETMDALLHSAMQ